MKSATLRLFSKETLTVSVAKKRMTMSFKFINEDTTTYIVKTFSSFELTKSEYEALIDGLISKCYACSSCDTQTQKSEARNIIRKLFEELIKKNLENIEYIPAVLIDEKIEKYVKGLLDKTILEEINKKITHSKNTKTEVLLWAKQYSKKFSDMLNKRKEKAKEINETQIDLTSLEAES